tara:strand:+ start:351 stop:1028 length:678 start_codon:yes stop_codon:yes gene_type:complete
MNRHERRKLKKREKDGDVSYFKPKNMTPFMLGSYILKFEVPMKMVDEINKSYDEANDLSAHNDQLAGKIQEEFKCTEILSESTKNTFTACFQKYLQQIQKPYWHCILDIAWINDMKAGEYNPFHYHSSKLTDVGLSSVLCLKKPKDYGIEYSREETPCNGWLEFNGGQQDPLSISQLRQNVEPGDLYIFPYTMLHGVYPFNNTDEVRRTMSFNCNLIKPDLIQEQ